MKKPNRRLCIHYVVGVDLGAAMQPTAIAVVEQEVIDLLGKALEVRAMRLRHLVRLPLDAPYHAVIDRVKHLLDALKEQEGDLHPWTKEPRSDLVVDITGTGRAVGDFMNKAKVDPILVTITGGAGETEIGRMTGRSARPISLEVFKSYSKIPIRAFKWRKRYPWCRSFWKSFRLSS